MAHIPLENLEVYLLARELSKKGWAIFSSLNWEQKKAMGFQFIESTDSVGANITEGYARFHFLDRIKFYYNARGSLSESADFWLELLHERNIISDQHYHEFKQIAEMLEPKLNNFIAANYRSKNNS